MRIDHNNEKEPLEGTDKKFDADISKIGKQLVKYGNELTRSNGEDFELYNARYKLHNVRLRESLILLNALCDDDQEQYKKELLEFVQTSSSLIRQRSESFDQFQRRWKEMNDRRRENYELDCLRSGIKKRKLMTNSIYIFLQSESMETLDLFWQEYLDGTLKSKLQKTMFRRSKDDNTSITITITEDNYNRYRKYIHDIGKCKTESNFYLAFPWMLASLHIITVEFFF